MKLLEPVIWALVLGPFVCVLLLGLLNRLDGHTMRKGSAPRAWVMRHRWTNLL